MLFGLFKANKLTVLPIDFATASAFVDKHHRHHKATIGHRYSLACYLNGELVGVAVCGRPVSRHLDDGQTIEINRLCVIPNVKNACSKLYSTCIKVAKKRQYKKVTTYTLQSENGASLKACGFVLSAEFAGGIKWTGNRKHISTELKKRWEFNLGRERK